MALSRYYNTPRAYGIQGKYVTLVRELSEFGDTVGVLDAHRAIIHRSIPLHFDMLQTMFHHFARINDFQECMRLLHEAIDTVEGKNVDGSNGINGANGANGANGVNGVNGTNGSYANGTPHVNGARVVAMHPSSLPREVLYNALLLALVENQRWDNCERLLAEMKKEQVVWDEVTYLLVARMHLQSGHADRMKDLIAHATENGAELTCTIYNYVLQHTQGIVEKREIEKEMVEKHIGFKDVSQHSLLREPSVDTEIAATKAADTPPPPPPPPSPPQEAITPPMQSPLPDPQAFSNSPMPTPDFSSPDRFVPAYPPVMPPLPHIMQPPFHLYPQYPFPPPPPYPTYEYAPPPQPTPPVQDRIRLQFPSLPNNSSNQHSSSPKQALKDINNTLAATKAKADRGRILTSMIESGVTPDESTVQILLSFHNGQKWQRACHVWNEFANISQTEIVQSHLLPLMITSDASWKSVFDHLQRFSIQSPVVYDMLLTKKVNTGDVQAAKELIMTIMNKNIAPSKDALVSALCSVMGENVMHLETLLTWLLEHGAAFDSSVYRSLALRIASSSSSLVVKRDALISLHRTMKQRRVAPDHTFFSVALQCVMASGECEPIAPLLLSMKNSGARVDQPLYSLLTVFLLLRGEISLAEQVDEDMRIGASDSQVALHYGYLRAYQDRGQLAGLKSNGVIPLLDAYYQHTPALHFPPSQLLNQATPTTTPTTTTTTTATTTPTTSTSTTSITPTVPPTTNASPPSIANQQAPKKSHGRGKAEKQRKTHTENVQ